MSGLGEWDRPGTPGSAGAWDARSEERLVGVEEVEEMDVRVDGAVTNPDGEGLLRRTASEAGRAALDAGRAASEAGFGGASDAGRAASDAGRAGLDAGRAASEAGFGGAHVGAPPERPPREASPRRSHTRTDLLTEPVPPEPDPPEPAPHTPDTASPHTPDTTRPHTPDTASPGRKPPARRGAVDPVKALMHRHHALCERAVDPLEIAAGLEAHGVTDRTAARFRHRDVFSLAEEMYARVPRDGEQPPPGAEISTGPGARAGWAALALLPGALCAAAVVGLGLTAGRTHLAVAGLGALAVALGLRAALRRGPLRAPAHHPSSATRAWTCWLIAYALLGDGLLGAGLEGGPDGAWSLATAPVLALALACAPGVWCAHLFAARARRRLNASRGLEEFAASVRPLLLGAFALFLCTLGALLALCGALLDEPAAYAGAGALGALLLSARLLTARGFTHAPAVVLGAAGAAEATALTTVFAGRLPGCSFLATPVDTVAGAWGAGSVPALVCGGAALTLLIHATRTLSRASAHALPPGPP